MESSAGCVIINPCQYLLAQQQPVENMEVRVHRYGLNRDADCRFDRLPQDAFPPVHLRRFIELPFCDVPVEFGLELQLEARYRTELVLRVRRMVVQHRW